MTCDVPIETFPTVDGEFGRSWNCALSVQAHDLSETSPSNILEAKRTRPAATNSDVVERDGLDDDMYLSQVQRPSRSPGHPGKIGELGLRLMGLPKALASLLSDEEAESDHQCGQGVNSLSGRMG